MRDVTVSGLSPSSLELWLQCPRKFHAEKYEGRSGGTGRPAVLGTFVHLVLERLMGLEPDRRTVKAARELTLSAWPEFVAGDDWSQWAAQEGDGFDVDLVEFRRDAWSSVCGLFQIEDPAAVDVVATERFVESTVDGVPLRGIVDRLEREDVFGDLVVTDYKTGKVPAPWFRAAKFRQLNLYAALVESDQGERPAEGRLLFTTYGEVVGTSITAESVAEAVEVASAAWSSLRDAESSDEWPAQPGPLCGWCPFVAECEAGLAEVRERRAAGKLKRTAPAWELAGGVEEA